VLLADADDEDQLRLVRDALTARLEGIGRRDRLIATWQPGRATPRHSS